MSKNNVISFEAFKNKLEEKQNLEKESKGQLAWLYCPSCQTMQYTSLISTTGRTHNKCGTTVIEKIFDLDLSGELTISKKNIEIYYEIKKSLTEQLRNVTKENNTNYPDFIHTMDEHITSLIRSEEEYISKLKEAAGDKNLVEYKDEDQKYIELVEHSTVNEFGTVSTEFRCVTNTSFVDDEK